MLSILLITYAIGIDTAVWWVCLLEIILKRTLISLSYSLINSCKNGELQVSRIRWADVTILRMLDTHDSWVITPTGVYISTSPAAVVSSFSLSLQFLLTYTNHFQCACASYNWMSFFSCWFLCNRTVCITHYIVRHKWQALNPCCYLQSMFRSCMFQKEPLWKWLSWFEVGDEQEHHCMTLLSVLERRKHFKKTSR